MVIAINLLMLAVSFTTHVRGRTRFGSYLGADFAAYYVAGSIFNLHSPERVYDRALHTRLYRELFPDVPEGDELPYVNAPFFILLFPLLARLSYPLAYLIWVAFSIGLYVAGLKIIWRMLSAMPRDAWPTALLLALSFMPFLVECLAGGQSSAFGFFWLSLALYLEWQGRDIISGVALAFCLYKPTLLALILPMLFITRRVSTLLGFAIGFLGLAILSLLAVGWQGCINYVEMLIHFTSASTATVSGLRGWKYVDINSFSRLLAGEHAYVRWIIALAAAGVVLPLVVKSWLMDRPERERTRRLVWAATITLTLVLNVYLGIYDATLVVISALLTTDVLSQRAVGDRPLLTPAYKYLLLSLYLVPWFTQSFARLTGIQLYTLILAVFGLYQLRQIRAGVEENILQSGTGAATAHKVS